MAECTPPAPGPGSLSVDRLENRQGKLSGKVCIVPVEQTIRAAEDADADKLAAFGSSRSGSGSLFMVH